MSFLNTLQIVINGYSTSNDTKPCHPSIDHSLFYSWMLLPSGLFTILLAFLIKRTNMYLNILGGRPGLLYPLNLFSLENRFTVAAAYGSIAFLLTSIVTEKQFAIPYSGQLWLKIFVVMGNVLIYGMAYYPLFAGLASRSFIGYGVASLFAWMFALMNLYQTFECDIDAGLQMAIIVRSLPNLISCFFLSFSLTFLFVKRGKNIYFGKTDSEEMKAEDTVLRTIRESHYGRHVRELFIPPPIPRKPESKKMFSEKAQDVIVSAIHRWIYHRHPNFRYPARIIAIITTSTIIIYQVTIELFIAITKIFDVLLDLIAQEVKKYEEFPDTDDVVNSRNILEWWHLSFVIVKGSLIAATCLSFLLGVLMCLHTLSSYRWVLCDTQGYQVAYALIAGMAGERRYHFMGRRRMPIVCGFYKILIYLVCARPIPFNIILILLIQKIVTKFVFCQDNGKTFGITNRRGFFVYAYFFFFYNIFMGFMSCLLRIFKSMVIGALMLGRLDQSTLPRKWQWFDPGFSAYYGFIHTEHYLMNPTVNTFIALLRSRVCTTNQFTGAIDVQKTLKRRDPIVREDMVAIEVGKDVVKTRVRTRWYLAYTLHNNPHLRIKRKAYLLKLKAKQEIGNISEGERKVSLRNETCSIDVI